MDNTDVQKIVDDIVAESDYATAQEVATAERSPRDGYKTEDEWLAEQAPDDVINHLEADMSQLDTWRLDWLLDNAAEIDDGRKRILAHLVVPELRDTRHPSPKYTMEFYCRVFIEKSGVRWSKEYQDTVERALQTVRKSKTLEWFNRRHPDILPDFTGTT